MTKIFKREFFLLSAILALLLTSGCIQKQVSRVATVPSTTVPSARLVMIGDTVVVDYIGSFENGSVFDTNIESEARKAGIYNPLRKYEPFSFSVGSGMVISGFDKGVLGMRVGENKIIVVPPEEGYSLGPLAGKTLIFNVTLREIKEEVPVKLTVLNDRRCKKCDVTGLLEQLKRIFPKLFITKIDYNSDEGRKLYKEINLKYLPALLFNASVKSSVGYPKVHGYLEPKGKYYSLRIGAKFDPTAEICDNGIDDNGDGKVDCEDEDCKTQWICMPKKEKPEVELFVMAYCPFGIQSEKGILPVLSLLGDKINFSVKFCTYAMHGKKELDEQLLQYCIQKEQRDKYLDYLACFLKEGKTEECLNETGIDRKELDSCIEKTDTEFNITENYKNRSTWLGGRFPRFDVYKESNEKYGIRGSPGLVINGVLANPGRDPESLLNAICLGFKDKPAECSERLSSSTPSPGFGFSDSIERNSPAASGVC